MGQMNKWVNSSASALRNNSTDLTSFAGRSGGIPKAAMEKISISAGKYLKGLLGGLNKRIKGGLPEKFLSKKIKEINKWPRKYVMPLDKFIGENSSGGNTQKNYHKMRKFLKNVNQQTQYAKKNPLPQKHLEAIIDSIAKENNVENFIKEDIF